MSRKKPPRRVRSYFGCLLVRNQEPGYRLPWTTHTGTSNLAADTLDGIKSLVRESLKKT